MTKPPSSVADGPLPWIERGESPGMTDLDSPRTKLVALCLARERSATLEELQELLGEPRLTLLEILSVLVDRGIVERVEGTYHMREESIEELPELRA